MMKIIIWKNKRKMKRKSIKLFWKRMKRKAIMIKKSKTLLILNKKSKSCKPCLFKKL